MNISKCVLRAALVVCLSFCSCGQKPRFLTIRVPAGSTAVYAFSDEQVCPRTGTLTFLAGNDLGDTAIVLLPLQPLPDYDSTPHYLTPGMPTAIPAPPGVWFTVGVAVQNTGTADKTVLVGMRGVVVRIP